MKPLCIDLFCGLGGWADGFLAEGYRVIGFDIERHDYGTGGYPGELVLQDVMTLHGSQFRDADVIVASPPCQAYSYRAMPWKRAKALPPPDNSLFFACFRIQQEASAAAGRHVPMVVENVKGAQRWVGSAAWHYGSFYLWGDVPAIMPFSRASAKVPGLNWSGSEKPGYKAEAFNSTAEKRLREVKGFGGTWFGIQNNGKRYDQRIVNPCRGDGAKGGSNAWFNGHKRKGVEPSGLLSYSSSRSVARKFASASIAKIPIPLAQWVAQVYKPSQNEVSLGA